MDYWKSLLLVISNISGMTKCSPCSNILLSKQSMDDSFIFHCQYSKAATLCKCHYANVTIKLAVLNFYNRFCENVYNECGKILLQYLVTSENENKYFKQ
jgi:hypothetical protein